MNPKAIAAGAVVLVLAGAGAAFVLGAGPGPGAGGDGSTITDVPTVTGAPGGTESDGDSGTAGSPGEAGAAAGTRAEPAGPTRPPFSFVIERIETCGRTCRNVTVTLHNNQDEPASNVVVLTRIFAGNSTDESDEVWRGSEEVGTLGAGESYTATRRVTLSFSEAYAVTREDGWITLLTTVRSDGETVTFEERRDVL